MIDIVVNPIVNEVSVSVVENPNSVAIVVNEVEQVVYVSVIENSGIATAILVNENGDELSETEVRNDETKTKFLKGQEREKQRKDQRKKPCQLKDS
jgi:hypothetical protein